jgi:branched-chain amino acid transport system permease protein
VYAAAPFVVWCGKNQGFADFLAVLLAVVVALALSLACETINHRPLEKRKASAGVHLVSSLGIYIILVAVLSLIWGSETKVLRTGLDRTVGFGTVIMTRTQVISAFVSCILLVVFYLWLRFADLGLQFRAIADNPTEFALRGCNVDRVRLLAFGVSGLLGGTSSLLVAYDVGFEPQSGLHAVLLAIVAVILGGRQTFAGPVIGALLLGVVRSEVGWFFSARWQNAITFLLLALVICVRPQGIIGRKVRLEAGA